MQPIYLSSDLVPLRTQAGNSTPDCAIYDLPLPVAWNFDRPMLMNPDEGNTDDPIVRRVEVSFQLVRHTNESVALVFPVDDDGTSYTYDVMDFPRVDSYEGVLQAMGFASIDDNHL